MLDRPNEPFTLKYAGSKGPQTAVPKDGKQRLITDLRMQGRVLVNFTWDETASLEARGAASVLKAGLRDRAQQLEVREVEPVGGEENEEVARGGQRLGEGQAEKKEGRKPGAMPKWLKLPGKK